ncbi:hypothetical protein J1605_023390 [Eschrichtius robustus]|uniref:Biogenesis of lysosome-related organelles complex 1 subunit 1 n=1 Tax=Eschrichtius robustus TaxID=9764 RepID=A0AB34H5K2_ESCRO|nr:hypothetical protein J1605_023390 [Eschrichtius robustus]
MLSRLLKEHQAKQNERKELQEKRRREAITAATCLTEALVDHLNVGYEPLPINTNPAPPTVTSSGRESTVLHHSFPAPPSPPPTLWQTWRAAGRKEMTQLWGISSGDHSPPAGRVDLLPPPTSSVAQAYMNQRKLDHEVKTLQVQAAQFAKQTGQWIGMVENFNQALKEIGDVENWARSIELDMRTIATALEYVYKGQLQSAPS